MFLEPRQAADEVLLIRKIDVQGAPLVSGPMALLREGTRAQHDRLDSSSWLDDATLNFTAYASHLTRVDAFQSDVERALEPYLAPLAANGFTPLERRKRPALASEIDALRRRGIHVLDCCGATARDDFPAIATLSAAIGCSYVVEGATLGGTVIALRIAERLRWDSQFYRVYGSRTAAMWRSFSSATEALGESLDSHALVEAARLIFSAYAARVANIQAVHSCADTMRPTLPK